VSNAETYDAYVYSGANTYASTLLEFAHGGTTAIATLTDDGKYPYSCAVDGSTGDLGVGNIESTTGAAASTILIPTSMSALSEETERSLRGWQQRRLLAAVKIIGTTSPNSETRLRSRRGQRIATSATYPVACRS
jgi:hypothetical protein